MKIVYTEEALRDLDGVLDFLGEHYPNLIDSFENRLAAAMRRIGPWPKSAAEVIDRPGVRMLPLTPFPYRLFYRMTDERIEILHIHHAARRGP